jgi:predicted  nucleic acid-binding Zn-ribbon protein
MEEYMGKEINLWEFRLETDIQIKIDEFGKLSDKIDRVKSELETLSERYREIEDEIRPVLEELNKMGTKSLRTKSYLVTIKRMGYSRENYKYKESFEKGLEKVNKNTRRVLEEILQTTKTLTTIGTSIGVQKIDEGWLKDLWKRVVSGFKRLRTTLQGNNKELDELNGLLDRMGG